MALTANQNLITFERLSQYDTAIKNVITETEAKSLHTVLWDSTNEKIKFYKKENATLADTADYEVSISSSDVQDLQTRVGMESTLNTYQSQTDITNILNVLTGTASTTGSVAKIASDEADAAETAAKSYADGLIAALDSDLDASGTPQHSGTFVVSGVTEVDGVITAVDSVEVETAGSAAALAATLGTAATADVATSAIQEESTDDSLVSAAQVATFVAAEIQSLEGAMHFVGVVTRQTGETDAQAIARTFPNPESGDVCVVSDNSKEYIYDGTNWREIGDEGLYVKKSTTIAGVDLQDDITKSELLTALNVADGAQVNVIETVQLNGVDLTPSSKTVNIELDADDVVYEAGTGGAADKTVGDAIDDIYTQIGTGSVADQITAAINGLDSTTDDAGVTTTTGESLNVLTSVSVADGKLSAKTITPLSFATSAQISSLFSTP